MNFVPSTQWQDVPDGVAVPPGGEYYINPNTGRRQARWDNPPPPDQVKKVTPCDQQAAAARMEHVATGLYSGEGLIWAVRDPVFAPLRDRKTGVVDDVKVDNGIDDKRLFVTETEFAQALRVMRGSTNILSTVLRSAWDTGTLRTLTKNSPARATDAHITIASRPNENTKRSLALREVPQPPLV